MTENYQRYQEAYDTVTASIEEYGTLGNQNLDEIAMHFAAQNLLRDIIKFHNTVPEGARTNLPTDYSELRRHLHEKTRSMQLV